MQALAPLLAFLLCLPAAAADPAKVLRRALEQAESTFDPALFQGHAGVTTTASAALPGQGDAPSPGAPRRPVAADQGIPRNGASLP